MISLLALAVLFIQATLEESSIEISIAAGTASITAEYEFTGSGGPLTFTAIRLEGQALAVEAVEGAQPVPAVSALEGLYRIAVAGNAPGELRVRYSISGDLRKIPLFVPDKPTVQGRSRLEIRITGADGAGALEGTFPRMRRETNGDLVARPVNLPGFLILPSREDSVTLNQVADIAVLVLILGASAIWIWTHRAARAAA